MKTVKKACIWFYMLAKRLLLTPSFILLLCIIPIITVIAKNAMTSDTAFAKISVAAEDKGSAYASKALAALEANTSSMLDLTFCDTPEEATADVLENRADAAWILSADFDSTLERYVDKGMSVLTVSPPLATIIEREESVPLALAKEKLYGALYESISLELTKNFIYEKLDNAHIVPEDEIKEVYKAGVRLPGIIEICVLNKRIVESGADMSTTPIRGLLSLVCALCALCAAMYFLHDKNSGKFDRLKPQNHIFPALATILSASGFAGIICFASLMLADISAGFLNELICMLVYIFAVTGFALVLAMLFKSSGRLGAALPGLIILMLVFSPIFITLPKFKLIGMLFPGYYYLNGVYDTKFVLYMLIYALTTTATAVILSKMATVRRK